MAGDACRYEVVRKCARDKQWKLVPQSMRRNANVIWVDTSNVKEYFHGIRPWQTINHFPGMTNIARKSRLAENLEVMRRQFPKEFSFCPKTYVLPQDAQSLRKDYFNKVNGKSRSYFIIKPSGGCQGRGIYLTRSWDKIDACVNCVAQKYIRRPLLIEKKKFDLRLYVLVTSCKPLRMYLFREGLVRLCTEDFVSPNTENIEDMCMHLTNYSINKRSKNFEASDSNDNDKIGSTGSKRSLSWFMSWLKTKRGRTHVDTMWTKIGHICVKTVMSILPTLVREYNATFGMRSKYDLRRITVENKSMANLSSRESVSTSKVTFDEESGDGSCESSINDIDFIIDYDAYKRQTIDHCDTDKDVTTQQQHQLEKDSRCFQILGFDILIDENLKPHLIEVNHLPSFGTEHEIDTLVKSRLIEQVMSIVKSKSSDKQVFEEMKKRESERRLFTRGLFFAGKSNKSNNSTTFVKDPSKKSTLEINSHTRNYSQDDADLLKVKNQIEAIYRKYAPHKFQKINNLFRKYRGSEAWLLVQVRAKYVTKSSEQSPLDEANEEWLPSDLKDDDVIEKECESMSSNESDENDVSLIALTSNENDNDVVAVEESKLLSDFDQIYPPSNSTINENTSPPYKLIEKYIFDQDFRQQMRLICPLGQARKVDPCRFKTLKDMNKEVNTKKDFTLYKVWSSKCWKENVQITKRRGSIIPLPKETAAPLPYQKQSEAADRLSRGIPSNETKKHKQITQTFYPSCYVDPTWQLSCSIIPIKQVADNGILVKQKTVSVLNRKGVQAEAIKPVNFEFSSDS